MILDCTIPDSWIRSDRQWSLRAQTFARVLKHRCCSCLAYLNHLQGYLIRILRPSTHTVAPGARFSTAPSAILETSLHESKMRSQVAPSWFLQLTLTCAASLRGCTDAQPDSSRSGSATNTFDAPAGDPVWPNPSRLWSVRRTD